MTRYYFLNLSDDPKVTGIKDDGCQAWLSQVHPSVEKRFDELNEQIRNAFFSAECKWPTVDEFGHLSFVFRKAAKPTSFLNFGPYFRFVKYMVDANVTMAMSRLNLPEHRLYPVTVSSTRKYDYWMFMVPPRKDEVIDIAKSVFYSGLYPYQVEYLRFDGIEEYRAAENKAQRFIYTHTLAINKLVDHSLDLFRLPLEGRYIVTEKFRQEMEKCGCTGMGFFPIEGWHEGDALLFQLLPPPEKMLSPGRGNK